MRPAKFSALSLVASAAVAWLTLFALPAAPVAGQEAARREVTRPVIPEEISALEPIAPLSSDGHRGTAFLRKPPGSRPFPAVVVIHGGLISEPAERLRDLALDAAQPSRFLAAGYVVVVTTYRSRDADPQSTVSLADSLAAVDYLRHLPYVDPKSIVICGCSGGGDLALQIAATTEVAAIGPEEPAAVLFTGIFRKEFPKRGERHTPADAAPIMEDPLRYYTAPFHRITRDKIGRIRSPILILQGDERTLENRFNVEVLIPELRAAGKQPEVITYPGEPHYFAFAGSGPQTPRPAAALKAFHDAEAFFRRHLNTKPRPLDPGLLTHVPLPDRPPTFVLTLSGAGSTKTPFAGRWHGTFPFVEHLNTVDLTLDGTRLTGTLTGEPGQRTVQVDDGRFAMVAPGWREWLAAEGVIR